MVQSEQRERVIAILIFDGLTVLDATGPYEVLVRLPGTRVEIVATSRASVRDFAGALQLLPSATLQEVPDPDVVVVPGGKGVERACGDAAILGWLQRAHETATVTTSVCTGSLLLGAASILQGRRATTHWLARERLESLGAQFVEERVVVDGDVITSAGVSAGIDMALLLASRLTDDSTAQAIQLSLEYAPEPPFAAGSPTTAAPSIVRLATELSSRRPRGTAESEQR